MPTVLPWASVMWTTVFAAIDSAKARAQSGRAMPNTRLSFMPGIISRRLSRGKISGVAAVREVKRAGGDALQLRRGQAAAVGKPAPLVHIGRSSEGLGFKLPEGGAVGTVLNFTHDFP